MGSDISTQSKDKSTIIKKSSPSKKPVIKKPVIKKPVIKKPVIKKPVIKKPVIKKPVIKKNGGDWFPPSTNFSKTEYKFTFDSKETNVNSHSINSNYHIKLNFTKFMFYHYLNSIELTCATGVHPVKKIFIDNYQLEDKTEYTINIELRSNNTTNGAINKITTGNIIVNINNTQVKVSKVQ